MAVKEEFSPKNEIFDWLEAICFSIVAVLLLFSFFVRSAQVEGASMQPTLMGNDRVLLVNTALTGVKQGDIVVVTQPTVVGHPLIKRVIATEGQTIDIDFETGNVYIDDILIEEPYIKERINKIPNDPVDFPFTVSKGCVFVMGDNRNGSSDSRDAGIGEIDKRYILGKAFYRILPFNKFGKIE